MGLTLTSLDIQNAFNSVPHEALFAALRRIGTNHILIDYIKNFLSIRYCRLRHSDGGFNIKKSNGCGVPQGDPISMLCFAITIQSALKKLSKHYVIVAYADDIIIGHDKHISYLSVIKFAERVVGDLGLTLSIEKCHSTEENDGKYTIDYCG